MTGRTRDYLADLANRKGVKLPGEQEREQAWASSKIEELLALPDANFAPITEKQSTRIAERTAAIIVEMKRWTFER